MVCEDDDIVTLIDGTNNSLTLTTVESVVGGSGNDNIGADHELLDAKLNGGEGHADGDWCGVAMTSRWLLMVVKTMILSRWLMARTTA